MQPDTRRYVAVGCLCTLLPAVAGSPCSLTPGDRQQGVAGTPSPAAQGRGAARRVCGAAIIPTHGRTWGREGKGLALGPMTLKDTPSASHSPPHGRAAGPARQLPGRAGRHFQSEKGGGEGGEVGLRGGARGGASGVGCVSSPPRRPSPARLTPSGLT